MENKETTGKQPETIGKCWFTESSWGAEHNNVVEEYLQEFCGFGDIVFPEDQNEEPVAEHESKAIIGLVNGNIFTTAEWFTHVVRDEDGKVTEMSFKRK